MFILFAALALAAAYFLICAKRVDSDADRTVEKVPVRVRDEPRIVRRRDVIDD